MKVVTVISSLHAILKVIHAGGGFGSGTEAMVMVDRTCQKLSSGVKMVRLCNHHSWCFMSEDSIISSLIPRLERSLGMRLQYPYIRSTATGVRLLHQELLDEVIAHGLFGRSHR